MKLSTLTLYFTILLTATVYYTWSYREGGLLFTAFYQYLYVIFPRLIPPIVLNFLITNPYASQFLPFYLSLSLSW